MSAFTVLNTAVYTKLTGGAALIAALGGTAIYYLHAPDETDPPFVIWSWMAGGDENETPNRTKNNIMLVRSFAPNRDQAGTIDALVDARLHLQTLSVTGWTNFWMARELEVILPEFLPNGVRNYVYNAQYRVRIDKD